MTSVETMYSGFVESGRSPDLVGKLCARRDMRFIFDAVDLLPGCSSFSAEARYTKDFSQSDYDVRKALVENALGGAMVYLPPESGNRVIPNTVCTLPRSEWSLSGEHVTGFPVIPLAESRPHIIRWKYDFIPGNNVPLEEVKRTIASLEGSYRLNKVKASDFRKDGDDLAFFGVNQRKGASFFYLETNAMKASVDTARSLYLGVLELCERHGLECVTEPAARLGVNSAYRNSIAAAS